MPFEFEVTGDLAQDCMSCVTAAGRHATASGVPKGTPRATWWNALRGRPGLCRDLRIDYVTRNEEGSRLWQQYLALPVREQEAVEVLCHDWSGTWDELLEVARAL